MHKLNHLLHSFLSIFTPPPPALFQNADVSTLFSWMIQSVARPKWNKKGRGLSGANWSQYSQEIVFFLDSFRSSNSCVTFTVFMGQWCQYDDARISSSSAGSSEKWNSLFSVGSLIYSPVTVLFKCKRWTRLWPTVSQCVLMQKNSLIDTFKYYSVNQLVWKWVIWPFKFLPNLPITVNKSYYIRMFNDH